MTTALESTALETTALAKRYRDVWALRDCSLTLPAGRVVALVGPNGAGKTTLMHLATGLLRPTTGAVRTFGGDPTSEDTMARVAFVAQEKPLYDTFTIRELLRLGRTLNRRWDDSLARERLAALDIPLTRRAGRLSGGQQAQVALSLALAKRPDLLLLDEPLANLDPLARRDVMGELMRLVADDGLTVVLSSHVIAELTEACDWLVVLNRGEVQVSGDIEALLAAHHFLSGPPAAADALPPRLPVIHRTGTERQANLLVRAEQPPADPRWTVRPANLEDLVLAYLSDTTSKALPGPAIVKPAVVEPAVVKPAIVKAD